MSTKRVPFILSDVFRDTKARAITRIGTPENESCLLSFARYGTASQLDQTVRLYREQYGHLGQLMINGLLPILNADNNPELDTAQLPTHKQQEHRRAEVRLTANCCLLKVL